MQIERNGGDLKDYGKTKNGLLTAVNIYTIQTIAHQQANASYNGTTDGRACFEAYQGNH